MMSPGGPGPAPAPSRGLAIGLGLVLGAGALTAMLVAVPSPLFDLERFTLPKELALFTTALVAGLALLAAAGSRAPLGASDLLLALLTAWSAVSMLFATNRWLALRALAVTAAGLVVHLAARRAAQGGADRLLRTLLVTALAAAALTGLAQAYGIDLPVLAQSRAPGGTIGNRNFLAHLMVIGLPLAALALLEAASAAGAALAALALLEAASAAGAALAGFALGTMTAITVLSRSRAAWLAALAALAVMGVAALVARRAGRPLLPGGRLRRGALAAAVGAALALTLPNALDWRSRSPFADTVRGLTNYREGSGRGRLIQYRNSLRLVGHDPVFGTGPGNWPVKYPLVTTPGDPSYAGHDPMPTNPWPSSDWIALLVERGPPALLLALLAGAAMVLTAARRLRSDDANASRRAIALLGLLTATAVAGTFDAVLLLATPMLVAGAGAGLLLPVTGAVVAPPLPSRPRRLLLGAVLGGLAVAASAGQVTAVVRAGPGWPVARLERAVRYDPSSYRLHLLIAQRTPCAQARRHARIALRLFPYLPAAARRLEECRR